RKGSWTAERPAWRLCHNQRFLNRHIVRYKFKLDSLREFAKAIGHGDFLFAIDLTSAYTHILIHPKHRRFMGFRFRGRYYVMAGLPFGLSCAPWLFTCFNRVVCQYIRRTLRTPLPLLAYIDDFVGSLPWQDFETMYEVLAIIRSFGFLVNEEKCRLELLQRMEALGFILDTLTMSFWIPDRRLDRVRSAAMAVMSALPRPTARAVLKVAGHVVSCRLALGMEAIFHVRHLFLAVRLVGSDFDSMIALPERARKDLQWILSTLPTLRPQPFRPIMFRETVRLECDTSDYNCAGYIVRHPDASLTLPLPLFRPLYLHERGLGSTLRELTGYLHSLRAAHAVRSLRGQHVLLLVDSLSSVFLLAKGGSQTLDSDGRLALMLATEELFVTALEIGCTLRLSWLPRALLHAADLLSKRVDRHDVSLTEAALASVKRFACLDLYVDRFASETNSVCSVFNSYLPCAHASAVDGLLQPWGASSNFCLPPFPLIPLVLDKVEADNAHAVLVVPVWPNTMWWQRLETSMRLRISRSFRLPPDSLSPNNPHCFFGSRFNSPLRVVFFAPLGSAPAGPASTHRK
ncbi:MAG: reverse transcriptase domain-containing protein, partial [Actinomycetota bacterium]|nr:reverse transcriptase domain-containing protein [Actinomycetota bacterium]